MASTVDVMYEGIVLAQGVEGRAADSYVFVPVPSPMPVGTRLSLLCGDAKQGARVARVEEAGEAGLYLEAAEGGRLPLEVIFPELAATPEVRAAAVGQAPTEPMPPDAEPGAELPAGPVEEHASRAAEPEADEPAGSHEAEATAAEMRGDGDRNRKSRGKRRGKGK